MDSFFPQEEGPFTLETELLEMKGNVLYGLLLFRIVGSEIIVNTEWPLHVVDDMYLSFNIDSASLYQGLENGRLNFENEDLIALGTQYCAASPTGSILRIGGSTADNVVFIDDGDASEYEQKVRMEVSYWNTISAFVELTGCRLVWDLCALTMRNEDGTWNSTNAEKLLKHIRDNDQPLYGLQLGNEPGHWYTNHYPGGVDGDQLGRDFVTLRGIVDTLFPAHRRPVIMGPDVCGPGQMEGDSKCSTVDYFNSILTNTDGVLDAVVVHHYGIGDCNLKSFTSPFKVYQPQPKLLEWRRHKIDVYPRPTISMILGETATAGSGGCAELSNRFVAGFWWIFTLGELGVLRYDKVFRQNFVGWSGKTTPSQYTLAGTPGWCGSVPSEEALLPNPDYFTSLLWMRMVGPQVLDVSWSGYSAELSLHANCAVFPSGAVVLSYSNLASESVTLDSFLSTSDGGTIRTDSRTEYFLTTGEEGNLQSSLVLLNGDGPLVANSTLTGRSITGGEAIVLPALSYGFIMFDTAGVQVCMQ